jgi:hypothetical protein
LSCYFRNWSYAGWFGASLYFRNWRVFRGCHLLPELFGGTGNKKNLSDMDETMPQSMGDPARNKNGLLALRVSLPAVSVSTATACGLLGPFPQAVAALLLR